MRIRFVHLAALAGLALSACGEASAPVSTGPAFAYGAADDLSGYYRPVGETRAGPWTLDHVFVGQAQAFQAWESGRRTADLAPVMVQFSGDGGAVRVLPTRYSVNDAGMEFEGRAPGLGRVIFSGRLDAGALATARRNLGDEGAVITGLLQVGEARTAVRLRWWMGD